MPVFSFLSDEKISCFGGVLIQSAAPCGANITWTHGETVLVSLFSFDFAYAEAEVDSGKLNVQIEVEN